MPRFYFTISDGIEIDDRHGTQLDDLATAMDEARKMARGLLKSAERAGLDRRNWSIRVLDAQGHILGTVPFVEMGRGAPKAAARCTPSRSVIALSRSSHLSLVQTERSLPEEPRNRPPAHT